MIIKLKEVYEGVTGNDAYLISTGCGSYANAIYQLVKE